MVKLKYVPNPDELIEYYGNPGQIHEDPNFADNLGKFYAPYPMRLSFSPQQFARNLILHKSIGPVVIDALNEIMDYKGYEYLRENNYDFYGGGFVWRKIRGGNNLSTHSYGIALDINPHLGPYDYEAYKNGTYVNRQPAFITEAFEKRGFVNLPWDRMHYQAAKHPSIRS